MSGPGSSWVFGAVALALGVGAAVFGYLLSTTGDRAEMGAEPARNIVLGPEAKLLSRRIERLLDVLEERDEPVRPGTELDAPAAPTTRDPLPAANDSSHAELLEALARLERVVREEARATRGVLAPGSGEREILDRIKDAERPADWAAWAPILTLWRQDPEAARAEVKLLTDAEVLDRFGTPTDVWSVDLGITWQYARDRDPVDGSYGTEVILRVPKGYVTQLAVRGRDF